MDHVPKPKAIALLRWAIRSSIMTCTTLKMTRAESSVNSDSAAAAIICQLCPSKVLKRNGRSDVLAIRVVSSSARKL